MTAAEPLDPESTEPAWTCVECGLLDAYNGRGDGIGSCMCSRCEGCGECEPCADQSGLHRCDDDPDEDEWEPWDDEDWLEQDDDGSAEAGRYRRVRTIDVGEWWL